MILVAMALAGPTAVIRPTATTWYLKVKGAAAEAIFDALGGSGAGGSIRVGRHVVASRRNLVDPVVAELRVDAAGTWLGVDRVLFHSLSVPRFYGDAALDGDTLVVTGRAAEALAQRVTHSRDTRLYVRFASLAEGVIAGAYSER